MGGAIGKINYLETLYKLMSMYLFCLTSYISTSYYTYLDKTLDGYVPVSITIYLQEPVVIVHVTIGQISGKVCSFCCC